MGLFAVVRRVLGAFCSTQLKSSSTAQQYISYLQAAILQKSLVRFAVLCLLTPPAIAVDQQMDQDQPHYYPNQQQQGCFQRLGHKRRESVIF